MFAALAWKFTRRKPLKGGRMDENNNGEDGELTAPTFKPEDVAMEVRMVLTKDGRAFLFFPDNRLAAVMALFSKSFDVLTGVVARALGEQEQRRVIPVTRAQMPPGLKLC
jgi:hypothetical protein